MLEGLREERDRVSEVIVVMERLAAGNGGKRRGRPPKWMQKAKDEESLATEMAKWRPEPNSQPKVKQKERKSKAKAKRKFSTSTRRKMAASQRRRWKLARKGSAA